MRNSNKMSKDYCPAGLKACKVPGVADQHAFEVSHFGSSRDYH